MLCYTRCIGYETTTKTNSFSLDIFFFSGVRISHFLDVVTIVHGTSSLLYQN